MKNIFSRLFTRFFLISFSFIAPVVNAALPVQMDGKELPSLAPMLENVTPGVVNIATEGSVQMQQNPLFADPRFRQFFNVPNQPLERKTSSLGSGVIVDAKRGLVLTNNHVIANAHQITVTLLDGRQLEAEVVGTDPATDVAVIKIPADNLTAVKTTDSDALRVGDFVVAIGNPFGLGQTVTSGIVSALGRSGLGIEGYEDFIQTDASINPGNSGGALVNLRGELAGINTAIISPQGGGNIGIGLAIPINLALQIMEQIVDTGEVKRGFLGVSMQDLNPALAEAFGLEGQHGAIVNQVMKGSPADKAGLVTGDIVLSTDAKPIKNAADLHNRIGILPVGAKILFKVLRDGKESEVMVTVDESPKAISSSPKAINELLKGVTVGDIDKANPYFGKVEGITVKAVQRGSIAWRSGLRSADIITSVNKAPVKSLQEFLAAVNKKNDSLLFRIIRGNTAAFLVLKK
ncbi:MAG TPA: DegQ family serine endoprotease [Thiotrichaceae bacterium]|jgi:serine protease Do/serine protease DegQ|nr:DegQ family serine endoprotease [Thiotrichaceae bacterium]HIM08828.1 DegQ family serine endoprotease [Gammaproteobacteria bacterium]